MKVLNIKKATITMMLVGVCCAGNLVKAMENEFMFEAAEPSGSQIKNLIARISYDPASPDVFDLSKPGLNKTIEVDNLDHGVKVLWNLIEIRNGIGMHLPFSHSRVSNSQSSYAPPHSQVVMCRVTFSTSPQVGCKPDEFFFERLPDQPIQ